MEQQTKPLDQLRSILKDMTLDEINEYSKTMYHDGGMTLNTEVGEIYTHPTLPIQVKGSLDEGYTVHIEGIKPFHYIGIPGLNKRLFREFSNHSFINDGRLDTSKLNPQVERSLRALLALGVTTESLVPGSGALTSILEFLFGDFKINSSTQKRSTGDGMVTLLSIDYGDITKEQRLTMLLERVRLDVLDPRELITPHRGTYHDVGGLPKGVSYNQVRNYDELGLLAACNVDVSGHNSEAMTHYYFSNGYVTNDGDIAYNVDPNPILSIKFGECNDINDVATQILNALKQSENK